MKLPLYTKIVLTVIALALVGLLVKPLAVPSTAQAGPGAKFEHIQFAFYDGGIAFFDTKTGDLWAYSGGKANGIRLVELGKPLQIFQNDK